jgi:VWFA-related protein
MFLIGSFLLADIFFGLLSAQQAPPNIPAVTLRMTSQLVLVDAVVKDKQGRPAEGLTAADFRVYEDGKPQDIATFAFERLSSRDRAVVPAALPLPPSVYSNRPEYNQATGPCTVLLLDALNTPTQDQSYARSQMLHFLEKQLQTGQRMAVFALGQSLQLLQDFTDDPQLLKVAVQNFKPNMSLELLIEDVDKRLPAPSRQTDTDSLSDARAARMNALRDFYLKQADVALRNRVFTTLDAFKMIARRLTALPGRKNLIWVSASFPLLLQSAGATSFGIEVQKMSQLMTDARVAVYPVDARGLVGVANLIHVFDASSPGTNPATGSLYSGSELLGEINRGQWKLESTQESMKLLSSQTGGLALLNRNDLDRAVFQAVADGSTYYVLGFYRKNKVWDGKFHSLKVDVLRRGLTVRSRRGYYAIGPDQWEKESEKAKDADLKLAMVSGSPLSSMITFDVRVSTPAVGERMQVPVEVRVDPRTLSAEDTGSGNKRYHLSFHVAAYAADGRLSTHKDASVSVPLTARGSAAVLQQGLPLQTQLEVSPGKYQLRVAVRDLRTGMIGTVEVPLNLHSP